MISPALARLWPSSSGLALIRDNAIWPQTIPAIAAVTKNPQQNPHRPRMLKMSERTANCSLLRWGTTTPGVVAAAVGETCGTTLAGAALTPGTLDNAIHPGAPSYHA